MYKSHGILVIYKMIIVDVPWKSKDVPRKSKLMKLSELPKPWKFQPSKVTNHTVQGAIWYSLIDQANILY